MRYVRLVLVLLLPILVFAGFTQRYVRPFGNSPGNEVSKTDKDTVFLPYSLCYGIYDIVFRVSADTVVDSIGNMTFSFGSKKNGMAWVNTAFATYDAGDTLLWEDDAVNWDTLTAQRDALPWHAWADSFRVIVAGKRATQAAKNCTLDVRVKK